VSMCVSVSASDGGEGPSGDRGPREGGAADAGGAATATAAAGGRGGAPEGAAPAAGAAAAPGGQEEKEGESEGEHRPPAQQPTAPQTDGAERLGQPAERKVTLAASNPHQAPREEGAQSGAPPPPQHTAQPPTRRPEGLFYRDQHPQLSGRPPQRHSSAPARGQR